MKKALAIVAGVVVVGIAVYAGWWAYILATYSQHLPSTTISVDGVEREYHSYVPDPVPSEGMALIVALQGGDAGAWPFPQQERFEELADEEGVVYAQPVGKHLPPNEGAWQLNTTTESMQDIEFVEAMVDDLLAKHEIDPSRVYAVGYSLGSMFSYELACHLDQRFAAIASFAGTMPVNPDDCEPSRNVPLLHLHGTDDPIIAYHNTWDWKAWDSVGTMHDIPGLIRHWRDAFGCREETETVGENAVHIVADDCEQGARVEHYRIEGGFHDWPEQLNGESTHKVIWSFLSRYTTN